MTSIRCFLHHRKFTARVLLPVVNVLAFSGSSESETQREMFSRHNSAVIIALCLSGLLGLPCLALTEKPTRILMLTLNRIDEILQQESTTTESALTLFDQLETVDIDFMLGRWQGSGLHTRHPMDGLLEATNWYGKEFVSSECVHPLLFLDSSNEVFKLSPNPQMMKLALRLPMPKSQAVKPIYTLFNPLLKTDKSQARLRMMQHRDKISATMIYDHLPIHDVFRKVDEDTLLGLMDYKESPQPFFFILKREILRT